MTISTFREEWQSIVDNVLMHATPDQMLNAENCFYAGVIVTLQNLGLSAVEGDLGPAYLDMYEQYKAWVLTKEAGYAERH